MVRELIGALLRPVRTSTRRSRLASLTAPACITVTSPSFADGGDIPIRHAGRGVGADVSPELHWTGVPDGTRALLLIVEDVDVPLPRPLWHTAAVMDPQLRHLCEGGLRSGVPGMRLLRTALGKRYSGPRPLSGHGVHHYRFTVLALSCPIDPGFRLARTAFADAANTVMASGSLTGTLSRPSDAPFDRTDLRSAGLGERE